MADVNKESEGFKQALGLVALVSGVACLIGLYFIPIPEGNREPILLGIGLVLGWGSTVIGYEFGSSPAGRKAADVGIEAGRKVTDASPAAQPQPVPEPQPVGEMNVQAEHVEVRRT